jgi:hypothetical protein
MAARAVLFEPVDGVVVVPGADADVEETVAALAVDAPEADRIRVVSETARDAAEAGAAVVLVWQDGFEPFGLWIQITPISGIRLARAFVRASVDGWVGPLDAALIGEGLEWFSTASGESDPRWSAVFADDALFVNLTLTASSSADLVARRALVDEVVLPSLVIADGAEAWRSDDALASGVIVAKERWPQLAEESA